MKVPWSDPDLRELAALAALAALGCGLALAQGDFLFGAIFAAASALIIVEALPQCYLERALVDRRPLQQCISCRARATPFGTTAVMRLSPAVRNSVAIGGRRTSREPAISRPTFWLQGGSKHGEYFANSEPREAFRAQ